ncbi:patatin-like phospholipase family protein [Roseomonas sp. NAR14]|uniref:Patatin-like phospholipase family protein n=1 Tax=Roseomonas acroporae TaxID=2937791 RepID=A0A9X2BXM8_9PROT|nr:patatin-like phospholipase family protein [Roseomonas acroporae]MCK8786119.1 patatin-like phospholipase family protein [Roseomonas acroporae]
MASTHIRPVTLALQGGGSLGAFAWGVLDRLLDEPSLRIEVVSGTSAGALNAAMLAQGLAQGAAEGAARKTAQGDAEGAAEGDAEGSAPGGATGGSEAGRAEAKRLLETLWRRVAVASGSPDLPGGAWLHAFGGMLAPMLEAIRRTHRGLAVAANAGPLSVNPLRGILDGLLDPSAFGTPGAPTLVVSATRVRTGEARLFRDREVTAEALLASACLPQIFQAVEIEGEAYWDGGYSSNPPVRPLIEAGAPPDVLIVRTGPVERPEVPNASEAVLSRAAEIGFDAALRHEIGSVATAQRLLDGVRADTVPLRRLREARLHMIGAEEAFRALRQGSALDSSWAFLRQMRALGVESADRWLAANLDSVGRRSTFDLDGFAGPSLGAAWPALAAE